MQSNIHKQTHTPEGRPLPSQKDTCAVGHKISAWRVGYQDGA